MIGDVRYKTKSGEIVGAKAPDFDESSAGEWDLNLAEVTTVKTAGGLTLMVAAIARWVTGDGQTAPGADLIGKSILQSIRQSTNPVITGILQDAIHATRLAGVARSGSPNIDLSAVVIALQGSRLYLAQAGGQYAYLIRSGKITQITPRHFVQGSRDPLGHTLPVRLGVHDQVTIPVRYQQFDPSGFIDNEIYLPDVAGKQFLDLELGDGIILSGGPISPAILKPGSQDELNSDFWRAYQSEAPSMIAHGLMQLAGYRNGASVPPVVVIKTESAEGMIPVPGRLSSVLWQAVILAAILAVSVVFGLVAAYGVPKLMSTGVIPSTGKPVSVPPGFLSVIETSNAEYVIPGKNPANLVTGSVVAIQTDTVLVTQKGLVRVQLSDGTIVALGQNSLIVLTDVANASQNQNTTNIRLISGQVLVDAAQSNGTTTIVSSPDPSPSQATGQVVGVQYTKNPSRLDVDCLNGTCQLITPTGKRQLATGQHSSATDGLLGGVDAARYSLWALMCGQACAVPVPTPMPTPYLGAFQWHNLLSPVIYKRTAGILNDTPQGQLPSYAVIASFLILSYGILRVIIAVINYITSGGKQTG